MDGDAKSSGFSRPGTASTAPNPRRPSSSFSWRKVSLLAAPLALGGINLVSAHFEKKSMIDAAKIRYSVLIRDGEQIQRGKINEAKIAGPIEQNAVIKAALTRAAGTVNGALKDADARRREGKTVGALPQGQAAATLAATTVERDLASNMLQAFRLAASSLGVRLAVSEKIRESSFVQFEPAARTQSDLRQIGEGLLNCKRKVRQLAIDEGNNRVKTAPQFQHSPRPDQPCSSEWRNR